MELVRNKASGKSFILLDDPGSAHFLLITPEGRIKSLDRRLFGPEIVIDPRGPQWNLHLTQAQLDKYAEYQDEYMEGS